MGLPAARGSADSGPGNMFTAAPHPTRVAAGEGPGRGGRWGGVGLIHTMNMLNTVLPSYQCWGLAVSCQTRQAGSPWRTQGADLLFPWHFFRLITSINFSCPLYIRPVVNETTMMSDKSQDPL